MTCGNQSEPKLPLPQPIQPQERDPYAVTQFTLRRGWEGPQVVISWAAPPSPDLVSAIKLVRKFHDYPQSPTDGIEMYSGDPEAGSFADIDLPPCRCVYYAVLSQRADTGEWVTHPRARGAIMPIQTGWFQQQLIHLLPELYLIEDKNVEENGRGYFALAKEFDSDAGEWRNIHEGRRIGLDTSWGRTRDEGELPDGAPAKGMLQRYLRVAGGELDHIKGLIDCLPKTWSVDSACPSFLPLIAGNIGLELNRDLSVPRQREEIKRWVEMLRLKGTKPGIEAVARGITGLVSHVDDLCDNVLRSNQEDRRSAGALPDESVSLVGLPGDQLSYALSHKYGPRRWALFMSLVCGQCLSRDVVEKLLRTLRQFSPACSVGFPTLLDCTYEEEYEQPEDAESTWAEVGPSMDVEELNRCWLMSNQQERVSNSESWRSMGTTRVACGDDWWDSLTFDDHETELLEERAWLMSNQRERVSNSESWRSAVEGVGSYVGESSWDEVTVTP